MPRTLAQVDLDLAKAEALIDRLMKLSVEQGRKIAALEAAIAAAPTVPESLGKIAGILEPLGAYATDIMQVKAGALGVRR